MIAKERSLLSKYLILAFYLVTMMVIVFYEWTAQNNIRFGSGGPLYRNLMECPAYVRRGFDPADIRKVPPENSAEWARFQSPPLQIMKSPLQNLPKSKFLSPLEVMPEEFTIIIPIEMDSRAMEFIYGDVSVIPGVYLASIGENWEIYLNGKLIRSEMHLYETGWIKTRRTLRDVYFPLDSNLLQGGTNVLAFRIVGDPSYALTGFFYSMPYYFEDYGVIERRQQNYLLVIFSGIFGFIGIYYLLLFFSVRRKEEVYNLFYSIFSILLCIYSVMRHNLAYHLFTNSDIRQNMEYFSLMVLMAAFGLFIETLGRGRATKVTLSYTVFFLALGLSQFFFSPRYSDNVMQIWEYTIIFYYSYVFFYDVIYFYFWDKKGPSKSGSGKSTDAIIFNVLIGTLAVYICGLYEILNSIFFLNSVTLFIYSTFVVQIGMAFTLSQRFTGMYKRLEQSNLMLEVAVHDRTQELEKQTEIAIQASRAKSQFLATMSHEIRTPMNAVIGLSEIVLHRGQLPSDSKNDIQQIHQSGSSLLGIINDILDISKIEAGSFELVPSEYDTASLINDTVNLNLVRIADKPIAFVLEIEGDFPRKLLGDELRVRQILNNIISNAVKYTREGKVTLCVEWDKVPHMETVQEAELRFTVCDTGIGIRQEDMGKLFSEYSQLDTMANRKIEGTGLGLAVTKKLLEMMGGTIAVESEYRKGSVFTVTLLQGIVDSTGIGEETANRLKGFQYVSPVMEKGIDYSWMPYGKVLVVDDMPVNLQVAKGLLEPYGLVIDTALSGAEAIEKVGRIDASYDIIFMDHMMPGMDGIQAVGLIRNEIGGEYCRNVPIIALTANALAGNMEMFLSKGFNGYISKPIDIAQLDETLNKFIRDKVKDKREKSEDEKENGTANDSPPPALQSPVPSPYSLLSIPGVDVQRGIALTGGKEDGYLEVLAIFCVDVEERLPLLGAVPDAGAMPRFITYAHAIKSASASIGALELSKEAAGLEAAGRSGDLAFIRENLPGFALQCGELVNDIRTALKKSEELRIKNEELGEIASRSSDSTPNPQLPTPYSLFNELAAALKSEAAAEISRTLKKLKKEPLDSKVKETLEQVSDQVLMAEYGKALEIVTKLIDPDMKGV